MRIESIDYYYSISPKDQTYLNEPQAARIQEESKQKTKMPSDDEKKHFEQLSKFKFPSNSNSNSNTFKGLFDEEETLNASPNRSFKSSFTSEQDSVYSFPSTPSTPRSKHSIPTFSPSKSPRRMTHRRSVPLSASSSDSIFSDLAKFGANYNYSGYSSIYSETTDCNNQYTIQNHQNQNQNNNKLKPGFEVKEPSKKNLQPINTSSVTNQQDDNSATPIIDLDILKMKLRPRTRELNTSSLPPPTQNKSSGLGIISGVKPRNSYFSGNPHPMILEDGDDEMDEGLARETNGLIIYEEIDSNPHASDEEVVDLLDFLRESRSDCAMSMTDDYDPTQYIQLDNEHWKGFIDEAV